MPNRPKFSLFSSFLRTALVRSLTLGKNSYMQDLAQEHNISPPKKRMLGTLLYLLLFTNTASWTFLFASYPQIRMRLPLLLQSSNFWFFALWYPVVFAGIALLSAKHSQLRLRLFLSGYLSIGLFHNCLWLFLFRLFGYHGNAFVQNLNPLDYPIPFFAQNLPTFWLVALSLFFGLVALLSVYSDSQESLLAALTGFLFLILKHLAIHPAILIMLLAATLSLFFTALKKAFTEYRERRTLWSQAFHPMLANFTFVLSACVFLFATFRGGLVWADIMLYLFTYSVVLITFGYAMVGDWHPLRNIFVRGKLFIIFWLFEAIFYDWSWWLAVILFGEPFRWSDPFYVDILIPHTTMLTFLIVAIINLLIGSYTFLFVNTPRALIPVIGYILILFAMIVYKLLLGISSWPLALATYSLITILCYSVNMRWRLRECP